MNTVLLLGAGVTRAPNPDAPRKWRAPLDRDFFEIATAIDPKNAATVITCLQSLVGPYAAALTRSLETATTYLYIKAVDTKTGSPYHRGFLHLLSLMSNVLAASTNNIAVGPASLLYRLLLSEREKVGTNENLTIITFNYDIVLERTLLSMANNGHTDIFYFPGCYRLDSVKGIHSPANRQLLSTSSNYQHHGVALLKLHGSMNWVSTHVSQSPSSDALLRPNRELYVVNAATQLGPGNTWKRGKRKMYLKPIIIPPISGKRGIMHREVAKLWHKATDALRRADRLVISGYSCPPLDLEARILLSESMRTNKTKRVYVVDPNPAAAVKFLELCGVDHITIYTGIRQWVDDAHHY